MTTLATLGQQLQDWSASIQRYNYLTTTPYYLLSEQEQAELNELIGF